MKEASSDSSDDSSDEDEEEATPVVKKVGTWSMVACCSMLGPVRSLYSAAQPLRIMVLIRSLRACIAGRQGTRQGRQQQ